MLGIVVAVMTIFAFKEYTWLTVVSNCCVILLYANMILKEPAQITYLISASYSLICSVLAVIRANRLQKEQEKQAKTSPQILTTD